jgi:hypothetical protein
MNEYVKMSIDARKNAFFNAYEITNDSIKNKIEDLFNRINEFGSTCSDAQDFETKFASSPLNTEYINLFTEVATSCTPITYESEPRDVQTTGEYIMSDIESEARYIADDLSMPARRAARQEAYDKARDIPILGDALYVKQNVDFFNSITGKYNKEENEEEE